MFTWLVVERERGPVLQTAVGRAWRGGAAVVAGLDFPTRKEPRRMLFSWADGVAPRRAPRWPEMLADWSELNDEKLLADAALVVLAEEVSGLGADALVLHGEPGLRGATVAWFEKGAVAEYAHVGGATVAWSPAGGLGRPFDGSTSSTLARIGRRAAELAGSDRDLAVLDRIDNANRATGETLLAHALHRMLGFDPPALDELAGMVAQAPAARWPAA